MDPFALIYRIVQVNLLTAYYCMLALLMIAVSHVRNLIMKPPPAKRRLEPPAILADPKYGVHKYIKINNIKLHYVESGDPTKPLMIFVHGFPEFWYSWRHQIVEFSKDYWCIAIDMRGYGDSERPEGLAPYRLPLLIEDVRDLIRQLGREKCTLVAHDWGGLVACRLRDVYPEVLDRLVILASMSMETWHTEVWDNPVQRKKSWYIFMYRLPWLAEYLLQMNNLAIFDKAMLVPGKNTVTPEDIECYKYWFGKRYAFTPPVNYYRANFVYDMPDSQPSGNVPMLLVLGEKDAYIELSTLDRMKKTYGNIETKIIENCAHFLQQEEPAKVNKTIRDFLSKTSIN